jgi:hypothetical protein
MASSLKRPPHPGRIVFEDAETGATVERDAGEVSDRLAFTLIEGHFHPVVRIVEVKDAQGVTQKLFSEDGVLRTTTWHPHAN